MRVLKLSGHQVEEPTFLHEFATAVQYIKQNQAEPVIIVHGGGRSIETYQQKLGLVSQKINGLRVTSAASLIVTEMVLSGYVNKLLVRALQAVGLAAVGISGSDGALLQARRKVVAEGDLGFVGEIVQVKPALLHTLLAAGYLPVVSPVSMGVEEPGLFYNVNGDDAATAVAQALSADQLDFISHVGGVWLNAADRAIVPQLDYTAVAELIATQVIQGGMIPKVQAALAAIQAGVPRSRIVDLAGLTTNGGTVFMA